MSPTTVEIIWQKVRVLQDLAVQDQVLNCWLVFSWLFFFAPPSNFQILLFVFLMFKKRWFVVNMLWADIIFNWPHLLPPFPFFPPLYSPPHFLDSKLFSRISHPFILSTLYYSISYINR